jgi:fructokinase
MMLKIGIDLGGTKTEAVILDEQGKILKRLRVPTEQEQPLIRDFQRLTGKMPETDNDANCFAVAEALLGAGSEKRIQRGSGNLDC